MFTRQFVHLGVAFTRNQLNNTEIQMPSRSKFRVNRDNILNAVADPWEGPGAEKFYFLDHPSPSLRVWMTVPDQHNVASTRLESNVCRICVEFHIDIHVMVN